MAGNRKAVDRVIGDLRAALGLQSFFQDADALRLSYICPSRHDVKKDVSHKAETKADQIHIDGVEGVSLVRSSRKRKRPKSSGLVSEGAEWASRRRNWGLSDLAGILHVRNN
jgi:hypothetical protein